MSHVTGATAPIGDADSAYVPAGLGHGVVPLRPLQAGEILDGAVTTMRAHPGVMLGLSALVVTIGQAAAIPLDYLYLRFLAGLVDTNTTLSSGSGINNLSVLRPGLLVNALVVSLLVGLLTTAVSRAALGRPVTLAEVWRRTRPRLLPLFGLSLLIFVALFGILVLGLLAAAALAVNRWVAWSLSAAALVLEHQPVSRALRRSSTLVKGGWWRVLGISLLAVLVSEMVAIAISALEQVVIGSKLSPVTDNGDGTFSGHHVAVLYVFLGALFSAAVQSVVSPFTASVMALQYVDRRMRREGLDIQLAMSARQRRDRTGGGPGLGVPEAGLPSPGVPDLGVPGLSVPDLSVPDLSVPSPGGPTPGNGPIA